MTERGEFDRLMAANDLYAESFEHSALTATPARGLAIVTCMDARLDLFRALGLEMGDAHIIRNAGGLATDDVIRSLVISQQLLGTEEIVVIGHIGCGLLGADEDALRDRMVAQSGEALDMGFGSFEDLDSTVRRSVERIRTHAWLKRVPVHGLVFDVATGRLRVVTSA